MAVMFTKWGHLTTLPKMDVLPGGAHHLGNAEDVTNIA